MKESEQQHIAIIGAGLVGSMLALLLAGRGHTVDVFERRPSPRHAPPTNGRSTHLVISERGWKALDAIGARDEVLRATLPLRGRQIHLSDGSEIHQPYVEDGRCINAIHRDTLNRILLDRCMKSQRVSLHFTHRCTSVDPRTGVIELEDGAGQRSAVRADRIFAADGARSAIRTQLLRRERIDYSQSYERFGYKELTIPATHTLDMVVDAMHAWPRGRISLFAFPNADRSFTATLLAPFDGEHGFDALHTAEQVERVFLANFADVDPEPLVEGVLGNPVSSLVSIRCSPWVFDRRVALIGDAAHAMLPFLGQGMIAGFEDCMTIDGLLDCHDDDFDAVFMQYERLRRPHSDAVTTLSSRGFVELTERIGSPRFHVQKALERKIHRLYPQRFVPPYELVAFAQVPYAEVLAKIDELEALVAKIMQIPDIEKIWDTLTVERQIQALVDGAEGSAPVVAGW